MCEAIFQRRSKGLRSVYNYQMYALRSQGCDFSQVFFFFFNKSLNWQAPLLRISKFGTGFTFLSQTFPKELKKKKKAPKIL